MIVAGARPVRLGTRRHRAGAREIRNRLHATLVGTDVQSDAIAELPRIGDLVGAGSAGGAVVLSRVGGTEAGIADAAFVVGERHRPAEGEAAPLDERAGDVGRFRGVLVRQVEGRERPQRAVGSLRPCVDREAAAMPGRVLADGAVLGTVWSGVVLDGAAGCVEMVVGPDIAREPDA